MVFSKADIQFHQQAMIDGAIAAAKMAKEEVGMEIVKVDALKLGDKFCIYVEDIDDPDWHYTLKGWKDTKYGVVAILESPDADGTMRTFGSAIKKDCGWDVYKI